MAEARPTCLHKLLSLLRHLGGLAVLAGGICLVVALASPHWLHFDKDAAHCGLFKYCFPNKTIAQLYSNNSKCEEDADQQCCIDFEDLSGYVPDFLHATRALLITACVIAGIAIFCQRNTCRCNPREVQGTTFTERHRGELMLTLAVTFTIMGVEVFDQSYSSFEDMKNGTKGSSLSAGVAAGCLLITGAFLMTLTFWHQKLQECHSEDISQGNTGGGNNSSDGTNQQCRVASWLINNLNITGKQSDDGGARSCDTSQTHNANSPSSNTCNYGNQSLTSSQSISSVSVVGGNPPNMAPLPSVDEVLQSAGVGGADCVLHPPAYSGRGHSDMSPPPPYQQTTTVIIVQPGMPDVPPPSYEEAASYISAVSYFK